jgi:site-specific DNA-methyltransferase (adenine-specific)
LAGAGRGALMRNRPTRGHRETTAPPEGSGQSSGQDTATGPLGPLGGSPVFVPHRHGSRWYLCDRRYVGGRRQHIVRGRCGRSRPTLYPPELRSGLVEQLLPSLPPASFDLVYLDPPYGITDGEWDRAPDWGWLGEQVARLLKPTGQAILHGQGMMSARAAVAFERFLAFRFELVWIKAADPDAALHTSILHGRAPMHAHELIHVFRRTYAKVEDIVYNPAAMHRRGTPRRAFVRTGKVPQWGWDRASQDGNDTGWRHPADVVFSAPTRSGQLYAQKPIDLTGYLIALLTNPGDRILDPYAGTGTTLLAAYGLGRRSIGFEASPRSWALLTRNLGGIVARASPSAGANVRGRSESSFRRRRRVGRNNSESQESGRKESE